MKCLHRHRGLLSRLSKQLPVSAVQFSNRQHSGNSDLETENTKNCDYSAAKPFKSLRGPKGWFNGGTVLKYYPRGKFFNKHLTEVAYKPWFEEYGDIYKEKIAKNLECVHLFDAADIQSVLYNEDKLGNPSRVETLMGRKKYRESRGLPSLEEGSEYRKQLMAIIREVLQQSTTLTRSLPVVSEVVRDFSQVIQLVKDTDTVQNVHGLLQRYTLEALGTLVFDQRLGLLDSDSDETFKLLGFLKMFEYNLTMTAGNKDIQQQLDASYTFINKFVAIEIKKVEKKKAELTDQLNNAPTSFIEELLRVPGVTTSQIQDIISLLLVSGVDPTSNTLLNVFYQLAKNPTVQDQLHSEVQELYKGLQDSTEEQLQQLKYMKAVVMETNRLCPVMHGVLRVLQEDTVIKGYQVPKGTTVMLHSEVLSTDSDYFDEPEKFRPERWLEGGNSHPLACLPFGYGSRGCVGQRFAEQQIYILLAEIISKYRIEYSGPDVKFVTKSMIYPEEQVDLQFIEREAAQSAFA